MMLFCDEGNAARGSALLDLSVKIYIIKSQETAPAFTRFADSGAALLPAPGTLVLNAGTC